MFASFIRASCSMERVENFSTSRRRSVGLTAGFVGVWPSWEDRAAEEESWESRWVEGPLSAGFSSAGGVRGSLTR